MHCIEQPKASAFSSVLILRLLCRLVLPYFVLLKEKGERGSTQKKIEEDMGVKIIIPTSKEEDFLVSFGLDNVEQECRWKKIFEDSVNDSAFPGVVAILRRSHPATEGISINSGNSASEKIQAIIDETVNSRSLDYSHFISLPLAIHPELVDKLINFQHSILEIGSCMDENTDTETDSNEDESTTTDTKKVDQLSKENSGVAVELKVNDNSKSVKVNVTNIPLVSYAPKASKSSAPSDLGIDKSIFIKPKTFHLTVLMLKLWNKERIKTASEVLQECIKGSLAKARVLYAPVEETGGEDRLLHVCQVIIDAYVEAGLVLENDAKQKLKESNETKSKKAERPKHRYSNGPPNRTNCPGPKIN
ncbi:hypothetical protein HKD37_13G038632 [Glycine soja]